MTSSIYNYQNEAKVWLPMTMDAHDPGNLRTLDTSGNGLHYCFGDGATATTYPTKLAVRGYSFDGTTDYLEALANQTNAITEGTWAVFYRPKNQAGIYDLYSHFDSVGITRAVILATTTTIQFYAGDSTNNTSLVLSLAPQLFFVAGRRTTDGYRHLYVNGNNSTPNNTGVSLPGSPAVPPRIARRAYSGNLYPCDVLWHGHWEYALSELQLRDLEARLRRQLNDV